MRRFYRWNKSTGKFDELGVETSTSDKVQVISDEMPPTQHPRSKKWFTSKTKFRAETKAYGLVEVGDAYERGYDPGKKSAREVAEKRQARREMISQIIESNRR